uniref:SUEL-type lectin domain-containing protein n=2 Tax=Magallana TaxID=2171616 RepID=A0A8W8I737_MAGGI
TKEIVKKRCNGRRKCTLTATNSIFGNPCHGTTKYLEVTFKCIHDDEKRSLKNVK